MVTADETTCTLHVVRAPSLAGICLSHEHQPLPGVSLQLRLEAGADIMDPAYVATSGDDGNFLLAGLSVSAGARGFLRATHPHYADVSDREVPLDGYPWMT